MTIGIPKEIKGQEYRVALLPSAAYQLIKRGHRVIVERSAGTGAGYPDADYDAAGAALVSDHAAVFEQADLVVKVKEPQPSEYPLLRSGQILFTYLHLAASPSLTEALIKSGVTALAYETVEVNGRSLTGQPVGAVRSQLRQLGLVVRVSWQPSDQQATRTVLSVLPSGRVPVGSTVTVMAALQVSGHGDGHGNGDGHGDGGGG